VLDERAAARQLAFLERVGARDAEQTDLRPGCCVGSSTRRPKRRARQVCSLYLWDDAEKVLILTATNALAQSAPLALYASGWVKA